MRVSLAHKVLALLFLSFFAAMGLFLGLSHSLIGDSLEGAMLERGRDQLYALSSYMVYFSRLLRDLELQSYSFYYEVMEHMEALSSLDPEAIGRRLSSVVPPWGGFLYLVDGEGFSVVEVSGPLFRSNLLRWPWGRRVLWSDDGHQVVLFRWRPWMICWRSLGGGFKLVYMASLEMLPGVGDRAKRVVLELSRFVRSLRVEGISAVFLEDDEGYRWPSEYNYGLYLPGEERARSLSRALLGFGFKAVYVYSAAAALDPIVKRALLYLLSLALPSLLLFALVLRRYLYHRVLAPLSVIEEAISSLSVEGESVRLDEGLFQEEELKEVARRYNAAAERIERQAEDLMEAAAELEMANENLTSSQRELESAYGQLQSYAQELEIQRSNLEGIGKLSQVALSLMGIDFDSMAVKVLSMAERHFGRSLALRKDGRLLFSGEGDGSDLLEVGSFRRGERVYTLLAEVEPDEVRSWPTLLLRLLSIASQASASMERERELSMGVARSLAKVVELVDVYTAGHSERVSRYSLVLARALSHRGLCVDLRKLEFASVLHDLGKVLVPAEVLNKPAKLSPEEYELIKVHPVAGEQIVSQIPGFVDVALWIRHHHERYDGKGYPDGLCGEGIPLESRIICLADALDAMTSERPYSRAKSFREAREEVVRCRGTQFDPSLVDVALAEFEAGRLP